MILVKLYILLFILSGPVEDKPVVPVYDFEEFEQYLKFENDSVYVINFWATWCKPCIKELPAFEKINEKYGNDKVRVILVSLDLPQHIESRLEPYIRENNIRSEVFLLDDPNANSWINEVDESWSGAIPATVIYNRESYSFFERSFTYEELDNIVKSKLNKK